MHESGVGTTRKCPRAQTNSAYWGAADIEPQRRGARRKPRQQGKQVGIMRELVPQAGALGILANPNNPRHKADVAKVQAAAEPLGFKTHVVNVGTELDLVSAFRILAERQVGAVIVC